MDSFVTSKYLKLCEAEIPRFKMQPFTLVVFGGGGDLSKRKLLPTLFQIFHCGDITVDFSIVGFGFPELSTEQFRSFAKESLSEFCPEFCPLDEVEQFCQHLHYIPSAFDNESGYRSLYEMLSQDIATREQSRTIYYLAVPPSFTSTVVDNLDKSGCAEAKFSSRIIVEKPFGRNQESAQKLAQTIGTIFTEKQIFAIDHYLGKETVQNILFFRFANSVFEPLWNRRYIDHVQITAAEDIGIGHRGKFYEQSGVVRDIVQNHCMQLIALVAMEPPVGFAADLIRDERAKVFNSIREFSPEDVRRLTVRGQYGPATVDGQHVVGYRQENNVALDSEVPTYCAAAFHIDNWRWANVPFFVRAGKRLAKRATYVVVVFRQPPLKLFGSTCDVLEPSSLVLRIQPEEEISLHFGVKQPGTNDHIQPVSMDFNYRKAFKLGPALAYQRLLLDAMKDDQTLFVRSDEIDATWKVVDPIIERWETEPDHDLPIYKAGSWGPRAGDALLAATGRKWIYF